MSSSWMCRIRALVLGCGGRFGLVPFLPLLTRALALDADADEEAIARYL